MDKTLHSEEAERALLGGIILQQNTLDLLPDTFKVECLYELRHQRIFQAILDVREKGGAVDIVTVAEALQLSNHLSSVGGASYLSELQDSCPTAANATHYADIIIDLWLKRRLVTFSESIRQEINEKPAKEWLVKLGNFSLSLASKHNEPREGFTRNADAMIEDVLSPDKEEGWLTLLPDIDAYLAPARRSCFVVIAGKTGSGKSALAHEMAVRRMRRDNFQRPVWLWTGEMDNQEVMERIACSCAGSPWREVKRKSGDMDAKARWAEHMQRIAKWPLYIDWTVSLTVLTLVHKIRRFANLYPNTSMFIVDNLRRLSYSDMPSYGAVAQQEDAANMLRNLQEEIGIPIVCITQYRGEAYEHATKMPHLAMVYGSTALINAATLVLHIWQRPDDRRLNEERKTNIYTAINIAKARGGQEGMWAPMIFNGPCYAWRERTTEELGWRADYDMSTG